MSYRRATLPDLLLFTVLIVNLASADPLHKFGSAGAWRHEDSGWLFPKQSAGFTRLDAPYTIDGNNDAGTRYAFESSDLTASAVIHIYAADSLAPEADFEHAKQAVHSDVPGATARVVTEAPFSVSEKPGLQPVKVSYDFDGSDEHASLYFVEAHGWTVWIRLISRGSTDAPTELFDRFVREQSWERLGIPGDHGAGS